MKSFVSWAVKNSPALNTLMFGILALGAFSMSGMRREVFPEFELEIVLVTVPYPGASPAEIEDGICEKVEEAVRSIAGIKKQTSVAQEGAGNLILELKTDVDAQKILNEVRSEVDRIPSFPELAEDPEVKLITLREAAIKVGVIGPALDTTQDEIQLREVAEQIRYDILRLPNVSQATLVGVRDYQIDIELSGDRLREYGLTLQDVAEIVRRENVELPGGSMKSESSEVLLRGKNKREVGSDIAKIPLVSQPNGIVLTVDDLGAVRDAFTDDTAISEIDGKPGVVISVDRTSTEDLLKIVDDVKHYVEEAELPPGYSLKTWADQSVDVRERLNMLLRNGTQGLLLVFLVLAIFLELKLAFWVALGIPVSVMGAGVVLLYFDQTLNMLSMFSFLMALGIVVDDAIVIGENIFEHRQRGKDIIRASIDGTNEVLPSVVASVSTTIIAFVPLMFVAGIMGKFIAVMPLAVIAMLVISLIESTFILPCHLAHSRKRGGVLTWLKQYANRQSPVIRLLTWTVVIPVASVFAFFLYPVLRLGGVFAWINDKTNRFLLWLVSNVYVPMLKWSVHRPFTIVCMAVTLLLVPISLYQSRIAPWDLFPDIDVNQILARITYPDGTPSRVTDEATQRLKDSLLRVSQRYADRGSAPVKGTYRAVGQITSPGALGPDTRTDGSHVGTVEAELHPTGIRTIHSREILDQWREEAGDFPGAENVTFGTPQMGPGGSPIEFKLLSKPAEFSKLEQAVELCKARLAEYPGVVDIRDDSRPGKWEFQIRVKEEAESMGIDLADVAETVRAAYYGVEVMRLQRGRHEVKLMVRYPLEERRTLFDFDEMMIRTSDGVERPLTELVEIDVQRGYSEVNRIDQLRSITITADVIDGIANGAQVCQRLQKEIMPRLEAEYPNISVRWEGEREQSNESVASLMIGFLGAMIAMYVLLTVEFRSYVQPILILVIIPFGTVGAVTGHAIMGLPISLFTLFGLMALTGVIVNDSIVLIDFINHRLQDGMALDDALIEAGRRRFRPVVLTSLTTIAGVFPILMETSFQAQILIPMAAALVFGLAPATILILVFVPTFFGAYWRMYRTASARPTDEYATPAGVMRDDVFPQGAATPAPASLSDYPRSTA